MRIFVLGADGYLGWPTVMHLASLGHDVVAIDSQFKRAKTQDLGIKPLVSGASLEDRVNKWNELTGYSVKVAVGDLCDWSFVENLFESGLPDSIVHYAEQPSAPFSMMNRESASFTLHNNLGATANLIFAVSQFCPNVHIVKLGTMGEYGTPNIDIEEGWLEVSHKGRKDKFLYPRQAGSLYHTTKIMDTDLLWFYVRTYGLAVTDLMQGPVYGLFTDESEKHPELATEFFYDEIFGTVLNRFIVQAVIGFPLTVYGKGGQTRGFLNLIDTLQCVQLAIENPAEKSELRIYNQFTELFSVNELADKVKKVGNSMGFEVQIDHVENPRKENEDHYYNATNSNLIDLGLTPNLLTDDVIAKMLIHVDKHKKNINQSVIAGKTQWAPAITPKS